jgi:aminocarboxymuconate-semialdehyde decarboxylase
MIVDVHAHGLSEQFIVETARGVGREWRVEIAAPRRYVAADYGVLDSLLYDIEGRLASLRKRHIGLQLVGPPPPLVSSLGHAASIAYSRRLNRSTGRFVAESEGLMAGLASPAVGEPSGAAEELRRVIGKYGFPGVLLPTSVDGVPLDGAQFEPLFTAIEELELLAFMHPVSSRLSADLRDYTMSILIGWPTETTVAVTRLSFAGVLARHPQLKLVLAHGGGTLPYLLGRIDLGYSAPQYERNPDCRSNIAHRPSDYLRQLYFDTTVCDPKSLDFLIGQVGADHVLFGSDFPYEIGDADGAIALPAIRVMEASLRAQLLSTNAERLLGLTAGPR